MAGRGHPDGDRVGLVLAGHPVTARLVPQPPRADALAQLGAPSPQLHELDSTDAGHFRTALEQLATVNSFAAAVTVYPEEDYRGMRMFVADDGTAGFALKGDEIVSVFIYPTSPYRGAVGPLLATAVSQGGRRLDCYDTVLPRLYAREGFVPVARISWDDQYAPDAWDYDVFRRYNGGRPDVVLMAYSASALDSDYDPTTGERVTDFDDAESLMQARLNREG